MGSPLLTAIKIPPTCVCVQVHPSVKLYGCGCDVERMDVENLSIPHRDRNSVPASEQTEPVPAPAPYNGTHKRLSALVFRNAVAPARVYDGMGPMSMRHIRDENNRSGSHIAQWH